MDPVLPGQASPAASSGPSGVFTPGQVLSARVIEAVAANTYLVAVRGLTLVAASESPLAADSVVRLVVQGGGGDGPVRVALAPVADASAPSAAAAEPAASADDPATVAARLGLPPGPVSEQVVAAFQRQGAPLRPETLRQAVRLLSAAAVPQAEGGDPASAVRAEDSAERLEALSRGALSELLPAIRPPAGAAASRAPSPSLLSTLPNGGNGAPIVPEPEPSIPMRGLPPTPGSVRPLEITAPAPDPDARTEAAPAPVRPPMASAGAPQPPRPAGSSAPASPAQDRPPSSASTVTTLARPLTAAPTASPPSSNASPAATRDPALPVGLPPDARTPAVRSDGRGSADLPLLPQPAGRGASPGPSGAPGAVARPVDTLHAADPRSVQIMPARSGTVPAVAGSAAARSADAPSAVASAEPAGYASAQPLGRSGGVIRGAPPTGAPQVPTEAEAQEPVPSGEEGPLPAERQAAPSRAASGSPAVPRGAADLPEVRIPSARFQRTWSPAAPMLSPAAVRAVAALPPRVALEAVARLAASSLPVVPATIPIAARAVSDVLPSAAALLPESADPADPLPARSRVDPAQAGPAAAIHTALRLAGIRPEAAGATADMLAETILVHRLVRLAAGLGPRPTGPADGVPRQAVATALHAQPSAAATAALVHGMPLDQAPDDAQLPAASAASVQAAEAQRPVDAATAAVREAVAQDLLPPKELADYDRVLALPLADHGQPVPARLAVTTRRTATGGLACWMRVDCELSRLGPVSVRLGSVDAGPVAITLFTTPASGAALAAGLPALAEDLRAVGVDAALRVVEEQS